MKKYKEPIVEIRPVAWKEDDSVLKYQGFVTVTRPNGTEKTMTGDPMSSQNAALQSLRHELRERLSDVKAALEAISE